MASIGSGVDDYVITQIEKRQDRYGQRSRSRATSELLNSNAAFVRLRSSVNEIIDFNTYLNLESGTTPLADVTGEDTKSRNSILTGGTLNASGKRRAGIDISPGINSVTTSAAYHNSDKLGFRPMPGITSATIKSKGDGGTLQEAEVNFTVWSIEDLNNFELCYFRVGYSALFEYGHTVYVDNNNDIQTITESQLIDNDDWFAKNQSSEIDKKINKIRKDSNGNYDALFGFIKNFNWKLRNDGGYDCSVSIISKGVVINALKEGKTTDHVSLADQAAKPNEKDKEEEGRSIFHFIFYRIDNERKAAEFTMKERLAAFEGSSIADKFSDAKVFRRNITIGAYTGFIAKFLNDNINLVYIPLGTFLEIVNAFCMLKDNEGKNIAEFNTASDETFRTFPGHFSVDPVIAVPPNKPKGKYSYCSITSEDEDLHQQMEDYVGDNGNLIRNIMVSTHFIRSKVEEFTDGPVEEGAGLLELIRNVLTGVQNALGEVNDFNIIWTEVEPGFYYYEIVDGKMPALLDKKDIPTININGLSNTVTDVSISSKIGPELASMVSIAAQGNTGNYKENLNNILRFNSGALDRHFISKSQNPEDAKKNAKELEEKKQEFEKDLEAAWGEFNKSNGFAQTAAFDLEKWAKLKGESISILTAATKKDLVDKKVPDPMPVPIELNLKLKGISGLKLLSTFKINNTLLPTKYQKFSYIISGLDHSIGTDNQWVTNITAKMFNS